MSSNFEDEDLDGQSTPTPVEPRAPVLARGLAEYESRFDRPAASASAADGEDVEMEDVAPRNGEWRVTNAPALPAPPKYSGSTMQDRRKFMRQYDTYLYALTAFQTTNSQPFIMPVSASVSIRTKRLICKYEMEMPVDAVTEEQWLSYFREALVPEHEAYTTVDKAMEKLKMDVTLPEAKSRVGKLVADMHSILDDTNMDLVMPDKEPKKLVEYMTAALAPPDFKDAVKIRLGHAQNKAYKTNVVAYTKWITELLKSFLIWDVPSRRRANTPGRGGGGGGRFGPKPAPKPPAVDGGGHRGGAGDSGSPPQAPAPEPPSRRRFPCLKCRSNDHQVRECPQVAPGEAERLIEEMRARRPPRMRQLGAGEPTGAGGPSSGDAGATTAMVDGVRVSAALLDTGADASLGSFVNIASVRTPVELSPVGDGRVLVTRKARFAAVTLEASAGPLVLRDLECWVHEEDLTCSLTVGRPVMIRVGYSTDGLLAAARQRQEEWQLSDQMADKNVVPSTSSTPLIRVHQLQQANCYGQLERDDSDAVDLLSSTPEKHVGDAAAAVRVELGKRLDDAKANGLGEQESVRLEQLLHQYQDVFRLSFGADPPVSIPPLQVRLKPDAVPVKCRNRRYPPDHAAYLETHMKELEDAGLVFANPRSRWASAPRIVAKKDPGQYRMTVDVRAVNAYTEPMPWPMPDLEMKLPEASGLEDYFQVDWWRGY